MLTIKEIDLFKKNLLELKKIQNYYIIINKEIDKVKDEDTMFDVVVDETDKKNKRKSK
jgi:hypothetical protein